MDTLVKELSASPVAKFFIITVLLDIVMGILRSIKYKEFNSSFGIDGAIRKCAMILCIIFLSAVDLIFSFNLVGYIPKEVTSLLALKTVGVSEMFALIFIACEGISILKNLLLCNVPIPVKLYTKVAQMLDYWTDELQEFDIVETVDGKGKKHVKIGDKIKRE